MLNEAHEVAANQYEKWELRRARGSIHEFTYTHTHKTNTFASAIQLIRTLVKGT